MKLRKTTNNVLGVVLLTPRKRTKLKEDGTTAGLFPSDNLASYAYVRITHVPTNIEGETVSELELDNKENIYILRKENVSKVNPRFKDSDIKGDIIFIDPFAIMGILDKEDNILFEEFGGTDPIVEK